MSEKSPSSQCPRCKQPEYVCEYTLGLVRQAERNQTIAEVEKIVDKLPLTSIRYKWIKRELIKEIKNLKEKNGI